MGHRRSSQEAPMRGEIQISAYREEDSHLISRDIIIHQGKASVH